MKQAGIVLLTLCATLAMSACGRANIENTEAVRLGMVEYLESRAESTGLDPAAMDVIVNAVAFERDVARASVSFVIKGTTEGMMDMNYTLNREGDKWVVEGRQDAAVAPHGFEGGDTAPQLPEGHVPIDAGAAAEAGAEQ